MSMSLYIETCIPQQAGSLTGTIFRLYYKCSWARAFWSSLRLCWKTWQARQFRYISRVSSRTSYVLSLCLSTLNRRRNVARVSAPYLAALVEVLCSVLGEGGWGGVGWGADDVHIGLFSDRLWPSGSRVRSTILGTSVSTARTPSLMSRAQNASTPAGQHVAERTSSKHVLRDLPWQTASSRHAASAQSHEWGSLILKVPRSHRRRSPTCCRWKYCGLHR